MMSDRKWFTYVICCVMMGVSLCISFPMALVVLPQQLEIETQSCILLNKSVNDYGSETGCALYNYRFHYIVNITSSVQEICSASADYCSDSLKEGPRVCSPLGGNSLQVYIEMQINQSYTCFRNLQQTQNVYLDDPRSFIRAKVMTTFLFSFLFCMSVITLICCYCRDKEDSHNNYNYSVMQGSWPHRDYIIS